MSAKSAKTMFLFLATIVLFTYGQVNCVRQATAVLYGANSMKAFGILIFTQKQPDKPVHITGILTGLNSSSTHGFHVHEKGVSETLPNCTAAGAHLNPFNTTHGPRTADIMHRHVGDLGNLTSNAFGNVCVNIYDSIIQLFDGSQSIVNRTAVVHLSRDDGGHGGFPDSHTTGNAGARIFCGLIKLSNAVTYADAGHKACRT